MDAYQTIKGIGKGSYGEVFLVKHKRDRKQYVLKKIDLKNASKRERTAAEQEAKLLSKLRHPNIVSYRESFEGNDGFLYIAMGYCEGGDLYTKLKEQKSTPLEERQIVEWFVQIAMALQYMHERNILHRDLKTQNIFLTKSKIIKVGDLGIARVLDSSSDMATTLIGTPYYMSPELFSNKPYNHKSDVWALGCCVYEMSTLKHAFNAKDMNSLVYKILRKKELTALIKAMMNHNPDQRPSVNRILKDPYIKRNIAIFLEGTKRSKRPVSGKGTADSEDKVKQPQQSTDAKAPVTPVNLEPLNVGPELDPIIEEPTPRDPQSARVVSSPEQRPSDVRNDARAPVEALNETPVAVRQRAPSPPRGIPVQISHRSPSPRAQGHRRASSPGAQGRRQLPLPGDQQTQAKRRSPSPRNSADSKLRNRPASPSGVTSRNNRDRARQEAKVGQRGKDTDNERKPPVSPLRREVSPKVVTKVTRSSERNPSRQGSQGYRDSSTGSSRSISPPADEVACSGDASSVTSRKKIPTADKPPSVVSHLSVFANARPVLQPRPLPSRPESGEPRVRSKTPRADIVESGYGSQNSETDISKSISTSTARARRREKKELETPRTARSTDGGDPLPRLRADPAKSVDSARGAARDPAPDIGDIDDIPALRRPRSAGTGRSTPREARERMRASAEPAPTARLPRLRKQPSLKDSSSESDTEKEDQGDVKDSDDRSTRKESRRKEKEMNNFISLLDTTLHMNKDGDDDDDDSPEPTVVEEDIVEEEEEDDDVADDAVKPDVGGAAARPAPGVTYSVVKPRMGGGPVIPAPDSLESLHPARAGQTLSATGRLMNRINILRRDCIRALGIEKLKRAFDILEVLEGDNMEDRLVELLGQDDYEMYAGKIWQLKFCEEAAFGLL